MSTIITGPHKTRNFHNVTKFSSTVRMTSILLVHTCKPCSHVSGTRTDNASDMKFFCDARPAAIRRTSSQCAHRRNSYRLFLLWFRVSCMPLAASSCVKRPSLIKFLPTHLTTSDFT
eukprot:4597621-Amphidinium_carterae.1